MSLMVGLSTGRMLTVRTYVRYLYHNCRRTLHTELKFSQKEELKQCYSILGLPEKCSDTELRESYLSLVKTYHPDSASKRADQNIFNQIDHAYRTLTDYRQRITRLEEKSEKFTDVAEEEDRFDIKHTAPQHRQYLDNEGIGFGAPSARQRQYRVYRVQQAADTVMEYRTQKVSAKYETQLTKGERRSAKRVQIRNAMDRLVEDLISASMANGEFNNLPGAGKPLKSSNDNPLVDTTTHNINRIMIENGYLPNWILLDREIKQSISSARDVLLRTRIHCGGEPMPTHLARVWDKALENFTAEVKQVNKKVTDYNLQVPTMRQQLFHFLPDREIEKVLSEYCSLRDSGRLNSMTGGGSGGLTANSDDTAHKGSIIAAGPRVTVKDVFREIKALFRSS